MAQAPEPAGPPPVPDDLWDTAAPDEVTRSYGTVSPEQAAAAATGPARGQELRRGRGPRRRRGPRAPRRKTPRLGRRRLPTPRPPGRAGGGAAPPARPRPGRRSRLGCRPRRKGPRTGRRPRRTGPPPRRRPSTRSAAPPRPPPACPGPRHRSRRCPKGRRPLRCGPLPRPALRAGALWLPRSRERSRGRRGGRAAPAGLRLRDRRAALATGRHVVLTGRPARARRRSRWRSRVRPRRRTGLGGRARDRAPALGRRRHPRPMADTDFQPGTWSPPRSATAGSCSTSSTARTSTARSARSRRSSAGCRSTLPDAPRSSRRANWRDRRDSERPLTGSAALLRRFAVVRVPAPDERDLGRLIGPPPAAIRSRRARPGACSACASSRPGRGRVRRRRPARRGAQCDRAGGGGGARARAARRLRAAAARRARPDAEPGLRALVP